MSAQPRIAFLLSSLKFGGGERVAVNLATALSEQGFAIDFVLMQAVGELLDDARERFNIVDLGCTRTWQLPWLLARYLRSARPIALISSFWKLNLCACLAQVAAPRVRLALWEHSPPSRSRNSPTWLYAISASLFYRLATCVVAVSRGVADDIRRVTRGLGRRVVTVYNAVPSPAIGFVKDRPRRTRRILWVGRLDDPKNPALMIEAMARLPVALAPRLFVLGDGPQRKALEAMVRDQGLRGRVRFLGFQADPYRIMARADLLALTSDREGLPTVLIEGLYAGLALVSTDCAPGVHEILDGNYGTIVPVGDADALASAIAAQLGCLPTRSEQQRGAERFAPARIANQFAAVLALLAVPHRLDA